MPDFFTALADPNFSFLRYAFLASAFASVCFGIIGSLVVARRLTYLAGSIAHCCLGGIALGLFAERVLHSQFFGPLAGALVVSLAAALTLGLLSLHCREREDTLISVLWSVGMAAGLLLLNFTPGYTDLMSYLFGDILLVEPLVMYLMAVLGAALIILVSLFYRQILATAFDHEWTGLRGVPANFIYLSLLMLTAVTVVLTARLAGVIMVVALLTIPAATAGRFSRTLKGMMFGASALCLLFNWGGLVASYTLGAKYDINVSSGPTIIVIAGAVYLLTLTTQSVWRRWRTKR
jgi:zinc transport system permease protein